MAVAHFNGIQNPTINYQQLQLNNCQTSATRLGFHNQSINYIKLFNQSTCNSSSHSQSLISFLKMVVSIAVSLSLFLLLQPWSTVATAGDFLAPLLSPILDDGCKDVKCGEGTCKPLSNSTFRYECECLPGWKQLLPPHDDGDQFLKLFPCVIPNCTLNFSCSKAPQPLQEKRGNGSIFDVCQWTDCGGGKCVMTSPLTHKCECSEGFYNLLNLTSAPCLRECSLGTDCKGLGIGFMDEPPPPPPSLSADRSNQANYRLEGRYDWLIFSLLVMVI